MNTLAKILSGVALAATIAASAPPSDINLASSLIASGGGPGSYSTIRAFSAMVGPDDVLAAEHQVALMDGQQNADNFIGMFDYAISDAWQLAGKNDVSMPPPAQTGGASLAAQLVQAGTRNGSFDTPMFFAQLFGVKIASQIMNDLDARYGPGASLTFTRMANHFFTGVGALLNNNKNSGT